MAKRAVSKAALGRAVERSTRASAKLENRVVPTGYVRSAKADEADPLLPGFAVGELGDDDVAIIGVGADASVGAPRLAGLAALIGAVDGGAADDVCDLLSGKQVVGQR